MNQDVVVCGAGAGGLAAACALGNLGLRVLVVDKRRQPANVPKGEVLQPGALALLRSWGVQRRLDERGAVHLTDLVVRDPHGDPLLRLDYGQLPAGNQSLATHDYPVILQSLSDSLGPSVELRRGVGVCEPLFGTSGRVEGVRVSDGDRQYDVRAAMVIAADGLSSKLRRAVGIQPRRADYSHRLVSFEIRDPAQTPTDLSAYVTDRGLRLCYPLPGNRIRLYIQIRADELRGFGPAELAAWLRLVLTDVPSLRPLVEPALAGLNSRQLLAVPRFVAPHLSVPGLAVLGEAGHAVHPMAAQGMNSSFTDAQCLAAQLCAHILRNGVMDADAVDAALREYGQQRVVNLIEVDQMSHRATTMITSTSRVGRALGRRAVRRTTANPRLLRTVTYNMSGLHMRPLSMLDRLCQLGLHDFRARRLPSPPARAHDESARWCES